VADQLLTMEAPASGIRLLVCMATALSREAAARHDLAPGSAAALAEGLTAALLLAAYEEARVDVQLECNGPLRGLLVDGDETGTVRGLVRVTTLQGRPRTPQPSRFDPRPLLTSPHDERAGMISVLRAPRGPQSAHRAAYPFAGADLGAALTLFLRSEREEGGEMAVEVLCSEDDPLARVAGVLVAALPGADAEQARILGKPLRQGALCAALAGAADASELAHALLRSFDPGPVRRTSALEPRFGCRCSRERVTRALRSVGAIELRDMADKDGGARLSCDFCGADYRFTAAELLEIAHG
jgi:molecular chaperone Hsp33